MMILTTASVLVCLFTTALSSMSKGTELQTPQGSIYGTSEQARNGRTFYSFRGIPFARPPIGTKRFKDPEAADKWSGVRNGSWIAPECPQPAERSDLSLPQDEDCLYLNVFTPLTKKSPMAVMVYIHGGGFGAGSMILLQPHFLLTEDVILVTIQYRIGLLGFLSTEDEVAPGNLGYKDQTQALRWVKANIQAYGGDPQRVTVFGESAGGISAHVQMFTPASRGLFNGVILQSGTAIQPGVNQQEGYFRQQAQELGQLFNCTAQESGPFNSTELISCLQQISASKFIQPEARKNQNHFSFRVDGDYMPASPKQSILSGDYHKCDIMAGITQHEGAGSVIFSTLQNKTEPEDLLEDVKNVIGWMMFDILPGDTMLEKIAQVDTELDSLVAQAIQYYVGEQNISSENYEQVARLMSSMTILTHDQIIQLHARDTLYNKNVFAYEFKHRGQKTVMHLANLKYHDDVLGFGNNWVFHGDDLIYLFPLESINVTLTRPEDIKMSEVMVELWTNFAMHGNPTPDESLGFTWSPVSLSSQRQQLVLKPEPYMETNDRCKDLEFWQSLPANESFIITEQKCEENTMCIEFDNSPQSVRQIYWRKTLATPLFHNNIYSQEKLMFPNSPDK